MKLKNLKKVERSTGVKKLGDFLKNKEAVPRIRGVMYPSLAFDTYLFLAKDAQPFYTVEHEGKLAVDLLKIMEFRWLN